MNGRCLVVFSIAVFLALNACAVRRPVSIPAVPPEIVEFPVPDAATELLYVHEHNAVRDSIWIAMLGPDSCWDGQGGRHVSVTDYLERKTRLVLKSDNSNFNQVQFFPCTLNDVAVRFRGLSAEAGAAVRYWVSNAQSLPALAIHGKETLRLEAVKHRSSLPDPLGLGKGSILNYRYTYRDSSGSEESETLTLVVSRFDRRVSGIFARMATQGSDTLKRYGMLNAELEPYSSVAVLWLMPDSYCRPRPSDFSGSCQLFWLRRDMLQALLSAKTTALLLGSFEQEQACLLNGGEHVPLVSRYGLQMNVKHAAVDACEFNFPGGRAGFIPCAANPLLLYVHIPGTGAHLELIGVEP